MHPRRRVLRELSDHEVLVELHSCFLRWRFGDGPSAAEMDLWCVLRAEIRRRGKAGRWRGCVCEDCCIRLYEGLES